MSESNEGQNIRNQVISFHRDLSNENSYTLGGIGFRYTFDTIFSPYKPKNGLLSDVLIETGKKSQPFVVYDIGCGDNTLLREYVSESPNITAVGISLGEMRTPQQVLEDSSKKIQYITEPVEDILSTLPQADIIVSTNTFSHLLDPLGTIIDTYTKLKPNGKMFIDLSVGQRTGSIRWNTEYNSPLPYIMALQKMGCTIKGEQTDESFVIEATRTKETPPYINKDFYRITHKNREDSGVIYTDTKYTLVD